MPSELADSGKEQSLLPIKLRLALWKRIDRRLQKGEVLITTEHFQRAMERDFRKLVRVTPNLPVRRAIREMIVRVNEEHPETYLTLGIKNAVTRYFRDMLARLEGESSGILEDARQRIKQMVREGRTAFFLESIGVDVGDRGVPAVVERAIEKIVSGERLRAEPQTGARKPRRRRQATGLLPLSVRQAAREAEEADGPAQAELPGVEERAERMSKMNAREKEIAEEELQRARKYLESYRKQELLEEEEVMTLRDLYGIDDSLARGDIDREEADKRRNEIDAEVRHKLDKRLRAAIDYSVHYLNAFESLRRLPQDRDEALRLLVRFKELAMSEDEEEDMSPIIEVLDADEETLANLLKLMERRDQEARMISANMPPYRYVSSQGRIANLTVEESFVDELRQLDREELSERLNSPDKETRIRPAADIRCMVALINCIIDSTPFHWAVLRLNIRKTITRLYTSTSDGQMGRRKVVHFLNQRMPRLYPELNQETREEMVKEGENIMQAIDQSRQKGEAKNEMRIYRA